MPATFEERAFFGSAAHVSMTSTKPGTSELEDLLRDLLYSSFPHLKEDVAQILASLVASGKSSDSISQTLRNLQLAQARAPLQQRQ